ncbi:MAG: hypothetical protein U5L96_04050 [Owenweeksia sp.]|nr:hypothetical protein [Owenweeksia sp.]
MPGDTVQYYIEAVDLGCPTLGRSPGVGSFYQFIVGDISGICASNSCTSDSVIWSFFRGRKILKVLEFGAGTGPGKLRKTAIGEI